MKTKIPDELATLEQANSFFISLKENDELFHIDDDANDIIVDDDKPFFSREEGDCLNKVIGDAFEKFGSEALWNQMPKIVHRKDGDEWFNF